MSTSESEFKCFDYKLVKKFFSDQSKSLFQKTVIQKGEDHKIFLKEEGIILKDNLDWKKIIFHKLCLL